MGIGRVAFLAAHSGESAQEVRSMAGGGASRLNRAFCQDRRSVDTRVGPLRFMGVEGMAGEAPYMGKAASKVCPVAVAAARQGIRLSRSLPMGGRVVPSLRMGVIAVAVRARHAREPSGEIRSVAGGGAGIWVRQVHLAVGARSCPSGLGVQPPHALSTVAFVGCPHAGKVQEETEHCEEAQAMQPLTYQSVVPRRSPQLDENERPSSDAEAITFVYLCPDFVNRASWQKNLYPSLLVFWIAGRRKKGGAGPS